MAQTTSDYRKEVTERLIGMLESGTAPWQKPWDVGIASMNRPHNFNGRPYHGVNALMLWCTAIDKGYEDPRWLTFNQVKKLGGHVNRGEKAQLVEYWQWTKDVENPETGEKETIELDHPKVFRACVFNADQCSGLPPLERNAQEWTPHERADRIVAANGVPVRHNSDQGAFYSPSGDYIGLPPRESFPTEDAYYSTLLHEVGHSTGHRARLNRNFGGSFGSNGYAREELRAELASTFLCCELGIATSGSDAQHAAYVKSWVRALKDDYNEIFRAAADAEKICNYLYDKEQEYLKMQELGLVPAIKPAPDIAHTADMPVAMRMTPENYAVGKVVEKVAGAINFDGITTNYTFPYLAANKTMENITFLYSVIEKPDITINYEDLAKTCGIYDWDKNMLLSDLNKKAHEKYRELDKQVYQKVTNPEYMELFHSVVGYYPDNEFMGRADSLIYNAPCTSEQIAYMKNEGIELRPMDILNFGPLNEQLSFYREYNPQQSVDRIKKEFSNEVQNIAQIDGVNNFYEFPAFAVQEEIEVLKQQINTINDKLQYEQHIYHEVEDNAVLGPFLAGMYRKDIAALENELSLPASERQIQMLEKAGLEFKPGITVLEADRMIAAMPATPEQLAFNAEHGLNIQGQEATFYNFSVLLQNEFNGNVVQGHQMQYGKFEQQVGGNANDETVLRRMTPEEYSQSYLGENLVNKPGAVDANYDYPYRELFKQKNILVGLRDYILKNDFYTREAKLELDERASEIGFFWNSGNVKELLVDVESKIGKINEELHAPATKEQLDLLKQMKVYYPKNITAEDAETKIFVASAMLNEEGNKMAKDEKSALMPASDAQKGFLVSLGVKFEDGITKGEANSIIKERVAKRNEYFEKSNSPASDGQKKTLMESGKKFDENITFGEASKLIGQLHATVEQMDFLDKLKLPYKADVTRDEASKLIEQKMKQIEARDNQPATENQVAALKAHGIEPAADITRGEARAQIYLCPATENQLKYLNNNKVVYDEAKICYGRASYLIEKHKAELEASRSQPATESQLNKLDKMNIEYDKGITKGQAFDLIKQGMQAENAATDKQLKKAEELGLTLPENTTKKEAAQMIEVKTREDKIAGFTPKESPDAYDKYLELANKQYAKAQDFGKIDDKKIAAEMLKAGFDKDSVRDAITEHSPVGRDYARADKLVEAAAKTKAVAQAMATKAKEAERG